MKQLNLDEVVDYVEKEIPSFHKKRLDRLSSLKLDDVLKRKNPYLFKAKNILTAAELVRVLMDAHLSSQEETIFGDFLENLARFVAGKTADGKKSSSPGIDLEMEVEKITYLVAIKSGPNWGNSSQINKMKQDFRRAQKTLQTNNPKANVRAVNGCCYGREGQPEKDGYQKLCGQAFWTFLSENENLYLDIIKPLGHKAREKNEKFQLEYAKILNRFTAEFIQGFCEPDGTIDWEKLVKFNSSKNP